MYYQYFGLAEAPFSIAVNPRYLYMSPRHRDALAHLLYGVGAGGGFILLTGEVGTGKTTLNRCLIEQLPAMRTWRSCSTPRWMRGTCWPRSARNCVSPCRQGPARASRS
jgi:ABC-type iron transport system FetAB ATPase subunit